MAKIDRKDESLKMLKTALEMEEKGKEFYEKAISSCKNEMGREVFDYLMKEEVVHVGRIQKIYANLKEGKQWNEDWKSVKARPRDLAKFFREMTQKHGANIKADTADVEALDVGIGFEVKSIDFYDDEFKTADDKFAKEFLELMILEEKKHKDVLEDMKMYLIDPEGWNARLDKLSYDGG